MTQTSFDRETARNLYISLANFCENPSEWDYLEMCWGNLQITWQDQQFEKFKPLFDSLSSNYFNAYKSCADYKVFLQSQIEISNNRATVLNNLNQQGDNLIGTNTLPKQVITPAIKNLNNLNIEDNNISSSFLEKTKHYWQLSPEEVANFQEFRQDSSISAKKKTSEYMGDFYGHKFMTDVLGYDTKLDPISKYDSFPQGFDAVYWDKRTNEIVIGEFKGQGSSESEKQKKQTWTSSVCEQIINSQGIYANAMGEEFELAYEIKEYIGKGAVRYELIQTKFDSQEGKLYSVIKNRRRSLIAD
jgi:hypothetical protein